MGIHISQIVGSEGGTIHFAWMGTCAEARGTGHGSNKWYAGVVVQRPSGLFDGLCAGGPLGRVSLYPQKVGAKTLEEARAAVEAQIKKKKREYADDPAYLEGYGGEITCLERKEKTAGDDLPVYWAMLAPNKTPDEMLPVLLADIADDATEGYVLEEKYNGHRKLAHIVPGRIRFVGRSGSVADPTRPLEDNTGLEHLSFNVPAMVGSVLDGELIAVGRLDGHAGVVNARASNPDSLVMVLYDLPAFQGRDLTADGERLPYIERRRLLDQVVEEMKRCWLLEGRPEATFPYRVAPMVRRNKREFHERIKAAGGEGTMAKNLQGLYHQGEAGRRKTCAMQWKLKHSLDGNSLKKLEEDVLIIGYTPGRGKYAGMAGAVKFGQFVPEKLAAKLGLKLVSGYFPALVNADAPKADVPHRNLVLVELGRVSGMTDKMRRLFTEQGDALLGRVMTISGSWRLPSGAIENPVFEALRPEGDKAPWECVWLGEDMA